MSSESCFALEGISISEIKMFFSFLSFREGGCGFNLLGAFPGVRGSFRIYLSWECEKRGDFIVCFRRFRWNDSFSLNLAEICVLRKWKMCG